MRASLRWMRGKIPYFCSRLGMEGLTDIWRDSDYYVAMTYFSLSGVFFRFLITWPFMIGHIRVNTYIGNRYIWKVWSTNPINITLLIWLDLYVCHIYYLLLKYLQNIYLSKLKKIQKQPDFVAAARFRFFHIILLNLK